MDFRCFAWLLQRLEWLRMQGMDSLYMLLTICFVGFWVRIHMVIGFSVDYTIHLGHMYVAADKEHGIKDRIGRFAFSIEKMGPTVVGGAATTLGAGAFMLPCQLQFFFKLGLLIFTTILYSFLFAFGFVMPLLAAVGPSGDQFSITPAKKALYGLFTGRPK